MKYYEAAHEAAVAAVDAHGADYPSASIAWDFLRQVEYDEPGTYPDLPSLPYGSLRWYGFENAYYEECRSMVAVRS